jgi:signal transduction histidine kinase/CheY-like chemotaxis protein
MAGDERFGDGNDKINSEIWRETFFTSPQAMLIATADETLLEINDSARELLNLGNEDLNSETVDGLIGRLSAALKKMIRMQRVSVQGAPTEYLLIYLYDAREQIYSERLLSFFATTLKSLDNPSSLSTNCLAVLSQAARIAVQDLCEWCRIDLRQDLLLGRGVVAHSNISLEPLLHDLQKIEFENPDDLLSPLRVIRSGISVFKENVSTDLLQTLSVAPRTFALLQRMGLRSYICVPIRRAEDTIGSIVFARSSKSTDFDAIDLMMAEEFAVKVGVNLERALLYKNLAEMKTAAESANRAKTNFLANVSHEIRTPLGAILGFSELLVGANSNQIDHQEWGSKIRNNSGHLLRLIDDILDLSKVEVGKLDLEIKKLDLRRILQDIYGFANSKAAPKRVKVEFVINEPLPRFIFSDETRLSQVLANIVGNAIKFTREGYIRVLISKSDENLLSFEVSDSGIGVNESQANLLFQPFTQADASHTRQFGGTGLGLALSRNLARGLGGNLILKASEPGKGSTFLITIHPGEIVSAETFQELGSYKTTLTTDAPEEDLSKALARKKILLVEDSTDIQALVKRFLEGAGAQIILAGNGDEGVRAALAEKFDAVLMDVQMPIKDGCQATQELRDRGYKGLIIALTANAMKEEQDRCLAAGFDAHLSKPMRRQDLIRNISRLSEAYQNKTLLTAQ